MDCAIALGLGLGPGQQPVRALRRGPTTGDLPSMLPGLGSERAGDADMLD